MRKATSIQQEQAEGDGLDSRSFQELFTKGNYLALLGHRGSLGLPKIHTCKMVICKGSSQLKAVEVLTEHYAKKPALFKSGRYKGDYPSISFFRLLVKAS